MTPPYLPAGPAHDADPAHVSDVFSAFFAIAFSNAFFMKFASHLGPQNRQKWRPGPKKCVRNRRGMRFSSIFGAVAVRNRFRSRFWTKKQQKFDFCICSLVRVFFSAIFSDTFSNACFMMFGSHLGAQNRQKSHPGPKKCVRRRRRMRFPLVFGAVAVRNRF